MKKFIKGNKYYFVVDFSPFQNSFYFSIEAIDVKRKTHSSINNLNQVLSELGIDCDDSKYMESEWIVSERKGKQFFKAVDSFLADNYYLEEQLDLDQELGEWGELEFHHKTFINKKH